MMENRQIALTNGLNTKVKEWTEFQANLDPDRRAMFNELMQDVQKYTRAMDGSGPDKTEVILLSIAVELKREIEDLRDQLELERIQHADGQQLNLVEATY